MALLNGRVLIEGLPPHRGILVSLTFIQVPGADAPPPEGRALIDADAGCEVLVDRRHLEVESHAPRFEHAFLVERAAGFYYLDLGVILYRRTDEDVYAQVEHFFFPSGPFEVRGSGQQPLTLPVRWPYATLEDLGPYETVEPDRA